MNLRPSLLAACVLFAPQAYGQSPGQPEPLQALGFTKTFTPAMVNPVQVTRLTFTIDNTNNGVAVTELAFVDMLSSVGIVVSDPPNAETNCGGMFAPSAGDLELDFSGGVIGAGVTCTLAVDVLAVISGALVSTSGKLSSEQLPETPAGASATLTVREQPLTASVEFVPAMIPIGGVSTLTYTLNSTNTSATSGIMMRDMLPAEVVVAPVPNVRTGCFELNLFGPFGQPTLDPLTVVAPAGGNMISFARGILGDPGPFVGGEPHLSCTIRVNVTSGTRGSYLNRIESLTSLLGDSARPAATLTVEESDALGFTKEFIPATVDPGDISRLTFTINNSSNLMDAGDLAFTDTFPPGMIVARNPNAETNCGGTFAPSARDLLLTFTGGRVAAGTTCTVAVDVVGLRSGTLMNTSDELFSDLPMTTPTPGARAMLTVDEEPLTVSMMFEPATISVGDVSTLTYRLSQTAPLTLLIELSDTLPDGVVVADPPNASTNCLSGDMTIGPVPGMVNATAGGNSISFSNGALGNPDLDLENPVTDCMITVDVTSTVAGSYPNETERVTSALGTSASATATLTVESLGALGFTKAFSPDTVDPGGISTLTFTIDNTANQVDFGGLRFSDFFPEGMIVADTPNASTNCTGATYAPRPRDGGFSFTGGSIAAGQSCTISVDVQALRPGMLESVSTVLTSDLSVASAAAVTLTVNEAPLTISMAFEPTEIAQGGVSRLTYELNNGAAVEATAVSLSDMLPTDLVVAADPNVQNDCGGTLTVAVAGTDTITYSGGSLAADSTCTISIAVTSAVVGSYPNETESVTSALGSSTPAQATLMVNPADALDFNKAFVPATVTPGGISRLTFTIDNSANRIAVGTLSFVDDFPEGMVVAAQPNVSTTCGGTFAPAAGDISLAFAGGSVAAGGSCTIAVDVQALRAGALENISGALISDLPDDAPGAEAMLTVNETPLTVSMSFAPATIDQGGVSRLTYELNNGAAVGATAVSLSNTLPTDLVVAADPNVENGCGGTLTAAADANMIAFMGGSLAADDSCTIMVNVTSATPGRYVSRTELVISSLGTSEAAESTLMVNPADALDFNKAFVPATVTPGGISRLTFTIDNSANRIAVGTLSFVDDFPEGMVVAAQPNVSTTCGGTFAPAAGDISLAFAGGSVAAGGSCTIAVDVQALRAGALENISGALISDLPDDAPGAEAMLTVNETPLTVSMSFAPATIDQGGVSRLTYELNNGAAVGATAVSLSNTLPTDLVVAADPNVENGCGGTLTAAADANMIAFMGGSLAADDSCTIMVNVTSATPGRYVSRTELVISSLGTSEAAESTLMVNPADALDFNKAFVPATVTPGGISRLTFTIDNSANRIAVGTLSFVDDFPEGMVVAAQPNVSTTCGGTFAPAAGDISLAFAGGSVAAGGSCTIAVDVQALRAGALENISGALISDLPDDAPGAEATLTVNETPLTVSMSFAPATIDQGGVSRLTYELNNGAAVGATAVSLSNTLPTDLVVAADPNVENGCGGTLTAAADANMIAFMGGSLAADDSCTIMVNVTSATPGRYVSRTELVISSLGTSEAAESTLMVNPADALDFNKAFVPATVTPGGISRLTFTIDNSANRIAVGTLSFVDDFPEGMVVAAQPNVSTTCGGTFAPAAGDISLAFAGGSVAAGGSCTIAVDVQALRAGALENISGALISDLPDDAPGAEATLTVNETPLTVSMSFAPATIDQGGVSRLTYELNNGAAVAATSVALSDTLPEGVVVASPSNASTTCPSSTLTVGGKITFMGGSLAADDSCTIMVNVTSATPGRYVSRTELVISSLGTSEAAESTLMVNPADALDFNKAFVPATVTPGGISRLTFTIDNSANRIAVGTLSFVDDFPEGMVVAAQPNVSTTCGGTFAPAAGDISLAFAGGSVAAGGSCTIAVDVQALRAGALENISGALISDLPDDAPGAEATLTVNETPLTVSMSFAPATIDQGGVSRLTYELNNGAAVAATSVALSDTLPEGVVVASPSNASTTCPSSTLTVGGKITFMGGSLAASGRCTIAVDVTSAVAGSHPNETESVTSSLGDSTPAEATLTVNAADAPGFFKMFSPDTIDQGGETQIIFTVDNGANAIGMTGMGFTDTLPSGVSVADMPGVDNRCGGAFNPVAGTTALIFTDGMLAAGAMCEIRVTVRALEAGTRTGPDVDLTSSIATATAAEATLTVNAADAPGFAKEFDPATVDPGGVSTLTFTIDNTANAIEVGSLAFDDDFPNGLVVAGTPNASTTCGGTFAPAAEDISLAFTGGSVAAGGSCTIAVDVQALRAGALANQSGALISDLPDDAPGAEATLTVNETPLTVSMSFAPATIDQGGVSRLTYELNNGAAVGATAVSLSNTLPTVAETADLVVAADPNVENGCGGTLTAAADGDTITYVDGALGLGETCMIAVDVTSAVAGPYRNGTESVTSSVGTSAAAEATLTVTAADAPGFTRVFSPDTIRQGGETQIVFTIDNSANAMEMTGMTFTDPLPSGVSVAETPGIVNTCNGTFRPVAGATTLAFADGTLAAGATCEIRVTIRAIEAGTLTNPGIALTSSIATATAAESTLTVDAADAPGFAKTFSPDTVAPGGVSRLTFTIDNAANAIEVESLAFTDNFPAGLVVADSPSASTTCGGTFAPVAGETSLAFTGGRVAAGQSCTLSVDVRALRAGALANQSGALTSDLPVATPGASATLTVNEAPLSVSVVFEPTEIAQGGVSRLTYGLDNGAAATATSVVLSDTLPADIVVADPPDAQTTCTGGTLEAPVGDRTITFTGGTLAAGATCTISVDVSSANTGSYLNHTESVTSSLGASTPAQATLTVDSVDALGFAKAFSPDTVDPGGVSTLTFTIDNGANAIEVGSLAFTDGNTDDFPVGLAVAPDPDVQSDCSGTFAPAAGTTSLAFTGGSVAAGKSCTLSVDVRALRAGALANQSGALTSDLLVATPGVSATLTVNEAPLSVTLSFEPTAIAQGGISTLTYGLNNGAAIEASEVSLSDTLPEDVVVASSPNAQTTCTDGTLEAMAGGDTITFTDGTLAAGAACTISVDVSSANTGSYLNHTESVTSSLGASTPAQATLTVDSVDALGFAKAFSPDTVDPGGVSTLTFTIDNSANRIAVGTLSFVDDFPEGMVVAAQPNVSTTCGGTVVAPAGSSRITHTGGSVAAGQSCTLSVDVQALVAGSLESISGDLTSDLPVTTPGVSATLTVHEAPLSVSMSFAPETISQGDVSRLTYSLDNGATVAATSVVLSDMLPMEIVVASNPNASTTCTGGTLEAPVGGRTITYTGGTVDASGTCTITVGVTSAVAGTYENRTESVTSALGISAPASATLIVEEAEAGTVTFNVESDIDGTFGFSTSEPDLAASLSVSDGTGSTGALPVAAGSHSVAVAGPRGAVLAAIDCDDTDSTADVSAETISLVVDPLEDVTCTITVQSSIAEAIKTINSFLTRRADLVLSSEPDPQRRFDRLKDGSGNASRLRLSGEDLQAFSLFTAQGSRGDYQASTSLLQARQAAASATLARSSSVKDSAYVENYQFDAWFDGQYKEFDDGADGDGYFAIAYAGVDYLLTPDILLGTVVSFDSMEEKTDTSTASGFGWMVGPQLTARLLGSHLYFDGRIAAGRSENRVSPFNTYTDDFWTWRWLSSASLTGEFQYDNWTIRPHTSLSYFEERQKSYVDSLGAEIPSQTVRLGQLKLGPTFIGHFESAEGQVYSPYLTVDAIYNLGDTTGVTLLEPDRPEIEGWRGNLEAGVSMVTDGGSRLLFGASYDGLGQSDFEAWGMMLEFSSPIGKSKTR